MSTTGHQFGQYYSTSQALPANIDSIKMASSTKYCDDDHFTLANLPFGVVSIENQPDVKRIATRLREHVYIFIELLEHGLLHGVNEEIKETLTQVGQAANNKRHFVSFWITHLISEVNRPH